MVGKDWRNHVINIDRVFPIIGPERYSRKLRNYVLAAMASFFKMRCGPDKYVNIRVT